MSFKNILNLIPEDVRDKILTVPQRLQHLVSLYQDRDRQYGQSYLITGQIMNILFSKGLVLNNEDQFNRYNLIVHMVNKLVRYSRHLHEHGHIDRDWETKYS